MTCKLLSCTSKINIFNIFLHTVYRHQDIHNSFKLAWQYQAITERYFQCQNFSLSSFSKNNTDQKVFYKLLKFLTVKIMKKLAIFTFKAIIVLFLQT